MSYYCDHCHRNLSKHVAINLAQLLKTSSGKFCDLIRRIAGEMLDARDDLEPSTREIILEVIDKAANDFEKLLLDTSKTFERSGYDS